VRDMDPEDVDYEAVAYKRDWCPEWLWWAFTRLKLPWIGHFVLHQPFRWIFTTAPKRA
jgi:hypothetical protein